MLYVPFCGVLHWRTSSIKEIDPHMNNEEFERKVEFIVNQQAQFAIDIQKLQEAEALTRENQAHMDENHLRMQETHVELQEAQKQTERSLAELATLTTDGFKYVIGGFQDLNSKFDALVDAQILTEESFRDLNAAFKRHLDSHNGV